MYMNDGVPVDRMKELVNSLESVITKSRKYSEFHRGKSKYFDNPVHGKVDDLEELRDLLVKMFCASEN